MTIEATETKPIWLKEHEECSVLFTPNDLITVASIRGKIQITICSSCGYKDVECLHLYNRIELSPPKITCLLCGS